MAGSSAHRQLCRIAGALTVFGAGFMFILQAMNPQPEQPGVLASYLTAILGSPYQALYLGITLLALLLAVGLAGIAATLRSGPGAGWATLAMVSAALGGAIAVIAGSVTGLALPPTAAAWEASGQEATALAVASSVWWIARALFIAFLLSLFGVTITLLGLAVAGDGRHPAWLGWLGSAFGLAIVILALLMGYLGQTLVIEYRIFPIVFTMLLLWVITLGVLTWRRAQG